MNVRAHRCDTKAKRGFVRASLKVVCFNGRLPFRSLCPVNAPFGCGAIRWRVGEGRPESSARIPLFRVRVSVLLRMKQSVRRLNAWVNDREGRGTLCSMKREFVSPSPGPPVFSSFSRHTKKNLTFFLYLSLAFLPLSCHFCRSLSHSLILSFFLKISLELIHSLPILIRPVSASSPHHFSIFVIF